MRRILEEFAAGRSPKAIARRLNDEGVPGPRGALWRDSAIRGHRARGTGILNNELYAGRLVWNRLRYIKDPRTGRRVSRRNDPATWIIEEVPELRIVEDALWERVRARQEEIEAEPRVQAMKESRFWEHRRAQHLLTGSCDVPFAAALSRRSGATISPAAPPASFIAARSAPGYLRSCRPDGAISTLTGLSG